MSITITEIIENMSADELIAATQEMEQLRNSPAWRTIVKALAESRMEADDTLHGTRADDQVAIAMSQATCSAIDHVRALPAELLRRYEEMLTVHAASQRPLQAVDIADFEKRF